MLNIYMDMEFTGLVQETTLISIGMVSESNDHFYATLNDYNPALIDEWITENVMKHLIHPHDKSLRLHIEDGTGWHYSIFKKVLADEEKKLKSLKINYNINKEECKSHITEWLNERLHENKHNEQIQIHCDTYAYDWVLFCELWGGALNVPKTIHYIPIDLSSYLHLCGEDPDINRLDFSGREGTQHNALDDALTIKACFEKIRKNYKVNRK